MQHNAPMKEDWSKLYRIEEQPRLADDIGFFGLLALLVLAPLVLVVYLIATSPVVTSVFILVVAIICTYKFFVFVICLILSILGCR